MNPTALMDYLADHEITTLVWAVSAMCFVSIMNGFSYRVPEQVNKVLFSGEVMPVKQLNIWKKYLPDAAYVNLYGPTEITCNCTYFVLDPAKTYALDEVIPAGKPFPNEKVFLLDEQDQEVTKEGEVGEICVGGTCIAAGYYREREKTEAVLEISSMCPGRTSRSSTWDTGSSSGRSRPMLWPATGSQGPAVSMTARRKS